MLNVIMLNAIMVNVIMLNVIMLNVMVPLQYIVSVATETVLVKYLPNLA